MTGKTNVQDYATEQLNLLLTRLASRVHHAAKSPGPDEIHDVRVSIRRFSQGLIIFAGLLPKAEVKKVRKRLKEMMRLTSEIRNRDIALEFLLRSGRAALKSRLQKERAEYQHQFAGIVRRWNARDFSARWRNRLLLGKV